MTKRYKFISTFQIFEKNIIRFVEIPIRIEFPQAEMPDEIGDYYVAFNMALDEARSMCSIDKMLIGIKYVEE